MRSKFLRSLRAAGLTGRDAAAICLTVVLLIAHRQFRPHYGWELLGGWLVAVLLMASSAWRALPETMRRLRLERSDKYFLFAVIALAAASRFFLLNEYPYINSTDSVRDMGFRPFYLSRKGELDFFSFGSYNGYGEFISIAPAALLELLGNIPLIWRIPCALLGVGAVVGTYVLTRVMAPPATAFLAALMLQGMPHHLFYSRYAITCTSDSLLAPIVILAAAAAGRSTGALRLFGLVTGLTFHFYGGARALCGLLLMLLWAGELKRIVRPRGQRSSGSAIVRRWLAASVKFAAGLLVALGPTLNYILAHPDLLRGSTNAKLSAEDLEAAHTELPHLYWRALRIYLTEPTMRLHFEFELPLMPPMLAPFFVVGLATLLLRLLWRTQPILLEPVLLWLLVSFPLVTQALIFQPGASHRLMAILPVLALCAALGAGTLSGFLERHLGKARLAVPLIVLIISLYHSWWFFRARMADVEFPQLDYVLQAMLGDIAAGPPPEAQQGKLFIVSDPQHAIDMDHYRQRAAFFTSGREVLLEPHRGLARRYAKGSIPAGSTIYAFTPEELLPGFAAVRRIVHCRDASIVRRHNCPVGEKGRALSYWVQQVPAAPVAAGAEKSSPGGDHTP